MKVRVLANERYEWALKEKERVESMDLESLTSLDSLTIIIGGDGTLYHYFRKGLVKGPTILVGHDKTRRSHLRVGFSEEDLKKVLSLPLKRLHCVAVKGERECFALADFFAKEADHRVVSVSFPELGFHFFGDGVIISSPFGSTAYNLSVGGPRIPLGVPFLSISAISPVEGFFQPFISQEVEVIVKPKLDGKVVWYADGSQIELGERARFYPKPTEILWFGKDF